MRNAALDDAHRRGRSVGRAGDGRQAARFLFLQVKSQPAGGATGRKSPVLISSSSCEKAEVRHLAVENFAVCFSSAWRTSSFEAAAAEVRRLSALRGLGMLNGGRADQLRPPMR